MSFRGHQPQASYGPLQAQLHWTLVIQEHMRLLETTDQLLWPASHRPLGHGRQGPAKCCDAGPASLIAARPACQMSCSSS